MKSPKRSRGSQSPAPEDSQTSITDLPDAILLIIFSLLPTVDAVRASAVTPPWCNLWRSLPTLDCDMARFVKPGRSNRESRRLFMEFVTEALRRRPGDIPIRRFWLTITDHYRDHDQVDAWIRAVTDFGAVDLDLDFGYLMISSQSKKNRYKFRFSDIATSSIEVLKLQHCNLSVPMKEQFFHLHSIKELHLEPSMLRAGEIELLIASCVNLEFFELALYGNFHHDLSIVSGSLRELVLFGRAESRASISVEICTPRLESISIGGHCLGMYTLTGVSSLVEATVECHASCWWEIASWTSVVGSLTGVERLNIHNLPVFHVLSAEAPTREDIRMSISGFRNIKKLKFAEELFSEAFKFYNLKHLTLKTGYSEAYIRSLESFLNKCPRVETLVLDSRYALPDEDDIGDSDVALQIPCLKEVKMRGYRGTKNELFVVDMLEKHGVVLETIFLVKLQPCLL